MGVSKVALTVKHPVELHGIPIKYICYGGQCCSILRQLLTPAASLSLGTLSAHLSQCPLRRVMTLESIPARNL